MGQTMSATQVTSGDFPNEKEAAAFFDSKINPKFFYNEKEVVGRRLFDDKSVARGTYEQILRIDRILHPTRLCFESGWKYGPIGIELKSSNIALGGAFSQILEQRQSIFRSGFLNNTRIIPLMFAIFPLEKVLGDVHSLLHTQLILACSYREYTKTMRFSNGNMTVLDVGQDICVNGNWGPTTKKGHRGRQK